MNRKKVGVIGYGYLGKAFTRFFEDHYDVVWYDPFVEGSCTKEDINTCDLAVVCVPTNMREDGSCDLTAIESTFEWLRTPLVVIKSAVPPGTTERLNTQYRNWQDHICVSPEYMGESKYFTPFWKYPHPTDGKMHDFLVVGGPEPVTTKVVEYFLKVMGPAVKIIKMSAVEAEIVKYMENSWGATKVTFSNEFYEICKVFGADFQQVREGFLADGRVERMHTMVLGGSRGFGGKCFPKDVSAIIHASAAAGYTPELLKQVLHSNEVFVDKNNV